MFHVFLVLEDAIFVTSIQSAEILGGAVCLHLGSHLLTHRVEAQVLNTRQIDLFTTRGRL